MLLGVCPEIGLEQVGIGEQLEATHPDERAPSSTRTTGAEREIARDVAVREGMCIVKTGMPSST